ncbi:MAG: hypothetical protein HOY71_40545, partial [Nonomuraea sp.]|nr:hypothetical protein [Nonomuraea sp.]
MRAFAVTVLVFAALAVPAGLIWSWVSPRAPYQVTGEGTVLADPSTQALIAADGWFTVITGAIGLIGGAVAWFVRRDLSVALVLGLCAGGVIGAYVTRWTGTTFTIGPVAVEAAAPGTKVVAGALQLKATGALVAWPLLAVAVFGLLEGMHGYREAPLREPFGGGLT